MLINSQTVHKYTDTAQCLDSGMKMIKKLS